MITRKSFVALGLVVGLVTGCSGENFDGSYISIPTRTETPAFRVDGDKALFVMVDRKSSNFNSVKRYTVSYKEEKMFLDPDGGGLRLVYARGIDEQGLDCLNCKDFHKSPMPTKWHPTSGDLDLEAGVKEMEENEKAQR